ncbi:MAG: glycosyltransferase family 9 protein [Ignavibacteria bacterium]|nr:glycosyltransferase family 9 protein [Ignavibacteria bacterium]
MKKNKSIVVVQIGKIGDMILTTPLFGKLKNIFPEYNLTVLASENNSYIPEENSSVDKVIVFKKNFSVLKSFIKLRSSDINYWIDTKNMYSSTSNMLVKNIKPERSLGFNYEIPVFTDSLNDYTFGSHGVDINLSPINFFTNTKETFSSYVRPEISIPDIEINAIENELVKYKGKKNVLINYSAGSESRVLSVEVWIEVFNQLKLTNGFNFFITGMKNDKSDIFEIINKTGNTDVQYIETISFYKFAAVINFCDLIITPDTSAVHICSALNKPVIGIYSDVRWNFEKFRPLSDINEVIFSGNENNMDGIKAGSILEKIHKILPLI